MKLLIWDFDGTLGYREGGAWTASLFEVLQREVPDLVFPKGRVTAETLRVYTQAGFPWLTPETPHLHLNTPDLWWTALEVTFERAYRGVGLKAAMAQDLARQVRATYLNPARWRRFDDVVPTLETLTDAGWTHVILTNHVPEFPDILQTLGLTDCFAHVFNSADLGYEKPHPQTYATVLAAMGDDVGAVWMIGDSYRADVQGAEAVGIPAILVRRYRLEAARFAATLAEVGAFVA